MNFFFLIQCEIKLLHQKMNFSILFLLIFTRRSNNWEGHCVWLWTLIYCVYMYINMNIIWMLYINNIKKKNSKMIWTQYTQYKSGIKLVKKNNPQLSVICHTPLFVLRGQVWNKHFNFDNRQCMWTLIGRVSSNAWN